MAETLDGIVDQTVETGDRALIEALAVGVVLLAAAADGTFELRAINATAVEALGLAEVPRPGQALADAVPVLSMPEVMAKLREAHRRSIPASFVIESNEVEVRPHGPGLALTLRRTGSADDSTLRHRLDLATGANGIGIWEHLPQSDRLIWNEPMFRLFGVDRARFGGTSVDWLGAVHPDDRMPAMQAHEASLAADGDSAYAFRIIHPDGRVRHVLSRARVVERDGDGRALRVVGINQDITALSEARERAEAAEARLMEAVEALPDGFVIYDRDDRLVLCNSRYREIYAASASALQPGRTFTEIIRHGIEMGQYPEARGREEAFLRDRLAVHAAARDSIEQCLPENRWVRVVERRTPQGDTVGFRVDITELKRQQQELQAAARKLSAASREMELYLSVAQDLLSVTTTRGMILRANESWRTVMGFDPVWLVGRRHIDFLHPDDVAASAETAEALLRDGRIGPVVLRHRDAGTGWRWLEWHVTLAEDGLAYCSARDVTERESELRTRALKAAEERVLSAVLEGALAAADETAFVRGALESLLDEMPWGPRLHGAAVFLVPDSPGESVPVLAFRRGEISFSDAGCGCLETGRCGCNLTPGVVVNRICAGSGLPFRDGLCLPIRANERLTAALVIAGISGAEEHGLDEQFLTRFGRAVALGLAHRRAAAGAARERETALAALAELSSYRDALEQHMILLETGRDGFITRVNENFERLTGYTAGELVGQTPRVLNSGTHAPDHFGTMWQTILGGRPWQGENCNRRRDGSLYWVQATIIPVRGRSGEPERFVALQFDITERQRLAESLHAANTRHARVAEIAGIGGWERDFEAGTVHWDDRVRLIYELPPDYVIPAALAHDFYPPESHNEVVEAARACIEEGRPFDIEVPFITAKGRRIWLRSIGDPKWKDGRIVGMVGAVQDVTARHEREAETERLRARFEAIFQNTQAVVFLKNRDGQFIGANRRFLEQVGRDDVSGLTDFDLTEPEVARRLDAVDRAVFESGEPAFLEESVVRPSGEVQHYISSKFLIDDPQLGDKVLVGIATDVTELKRRNAENERLRARFDAFLANTASLIFLKRRDGTFVTANQRLLDFLGVTSVAGCRSADFSPPEIAAALEAVDRRVFETGRPAFVEETVLRRGEPRHFLTSKFLIPDAEEGDMLLCAVATEITEQKKLQASLESSRRDAEAANRAKSQFLATMSHEIRTPMNGVIGMAALLDRAVTDPEHRRMVGVIRESGDVLLNVINDILDFSKIEGGKIDIERTPLLLREVARKVESIHALKAAEKSLRFTVLMGTETTAARIGDPHRLQQILHNLVGNAVKFTERGEVALTIRAPDPQTVVIVVRDTGLGMTPAQLERVFDKFAQADSSTTRRFGGTGLGLPIVKGLVEAMGGRLDVTSTPGAGTSFTVTLPMPLCEPVVGTPALTADAPLPAGLRVLAADDNEVNRLVLGAYLQALGVSVHMVEGGAEAVAARETEAFDALMLDISMPGMDGIEALAAIRAREAALGLPTIPAIAVTANAMTHQITEYLAAGFDSHIAKPLRREDLIDRLQMVAVRREARR